MHISVTKKRKKGGMDNEYDTQLIQGIKTTIHLMVLFQLVLIVKDGNLFFLLKKGKTFDLVSLKTHAQ